MNSALEKECYFVYNRELAISLKNKFQKKISEFLKDRDLHVLEGYETFISIKLIKSGKPTHLFTMQEIEGEMRKADDYIASLQGWLLYLKNGQNQYMEFVQENANEEELLVEIKKY